MNKQDAIKALNNYMDGKDNVKADVLSAVFCEDGVVEFDVQTPNINFPDKITGSENIGKEMFGNFHSQFEHVKSYYLEERFNDLSSKNSIHNQKWLVTMLERESSKSRVGTGEYNWNFVKQGDKWLVTKLQIFIHSMISFYPDDEKWLNKFQDKCVDYPWLGKKTAVSLLKNEKELQQVTDYISE